MKAIFLTSSLNNYYKENGVTVAINIDNSNSFVTNLKKVNENIKKICFIPSSPKNKEKTKAYSDIVFKSFNLDCGCKECVVIDEDSKNIKEEILSSDLVFLLGGHVPTQNEFIKKINLKEILKDYEGIVVGQSAGSMNCSETVYIQPECEEEMLDKDFDKLATGLGLTKLIVMPHINRAKTDELLGVSAYDMCLEDSKYIPHIGFVDSGFIQIDENGINLYGEGYLFKDGKCTKICKNGETINLEEYKELFNDVKGLKQPRKIV